MIGFFGGTFDPPHFGHLHLAEELLERKGLKEVWFCPAHQSPFKPNRPKASGEDRLAMVRLAIEGYPHFKAIDTEIVKEGPSFTIDTLRALPGNFRLIIGEDQISSLHLWKESEALLQLAPPLIGARSRSEKVEKNFDIIEMPMVDISSTDIRRRLKEKRPCQHLVPGKVLDYIFSHELYYE